MKCKPTAGYPSRTDAVLALRALGLPTRDIAALLNIDPSSISGFVASRERRERRRGAPAAPARTVSLPVDLVDALAPHAARRRLHVDQLASAILSHVVLDGLVDAVLDDADAPGAGTRPDAPVHHLGPA